MFWVVWEFLKNSWIGKALAIVAAVSVTLWIAYSRGAKAAREHEAVRKSRAVKDMKEIRDEVETLPDSERLNELTRFVRRK